MSNAGKFNWRANFYNNTEDMTPARTELIEASSEDEAANIAIKNMGDTMRVDVIRTITRDKPPA